MIGRARARRPEDGAVVLAAIRRLGRSSPDGPLDPVATGRLLLVAVGVVVMLAMPLLHADPHTWIALLAVSCAMLALLAASQLVPWQRLSPRATLAFPLLVAVGLALLSLDQRGIVAPLTGLISLCFAYIGMTQPPRTSVFAVPVAAVVFVLANGALTQPILVRLFIAVSIWTLLAELLAGFTVRANQLATALRAAAHTDALTGLANRRDLQLRLPASVPGDAVVVCDLDHFKRVNDTLGHAGGDRVLADFGTMLRACLRAGDYCARFGGEEFVLLLPGSRAVDVRPVLDRLRTAWTVLQPAVTFSAGIACCRDDRSPAETLAAADRALYAAKQSGRNCDRIEAVPVSG